jgi:molybdopterin/thiamine biosynthesis adenylyltransferase
VTLAYSRPAAVAVRLVKDSLASQLLSKPVLLTADMVALETPAGRSTYLAALSLLTRFCAQLTVRLPGSGSKFHAQVDALAKRIHYAGAINLIGDGAPDWQRFGAVLNVGGTLRRDLPWTSIACDGWAVQVCSTGGPMALKFRCFNPAATLAVASLGATEVFKRLLGVLPDQGPLFNNEIFSLLDYTVTTDPGPDIRGPIKLDCLLAGHGAIGNGIRHVLLELPLEGWIAIVDNQAAGEENWGTYIDLDRHGFGHPKAEIAASGWGHSVTPVAFPLDLSAAVGLVGTHIPHPSVVLSGLDNIPARHELQQFWPDLLIDGAIGEVTCQVSVHPWGRNTACLYCLFREPPGEDAVVLGARLSGLTVQSAALAEEIVTRADVEAAPGDQKGWLEQRIGRKKCSVIAEAVVAKLTAGAANFSPSAPFVATLSGALVAGEFVKARLGIETQLDPRYQFNVLRGLSTGTLLDQGRRPACLCQERAASVERWRRIVKTYPLLTPVPPPKT